MKRREFIAALGGAAAALPLSARAQQAMPVIGFLGGGSSTTHASHLIAIHRGLAEHGFIPGQNVVFEHKISDGQTELLPDMASDLVRRRVNLIIAASGAQTALAAKAATSTIPIVFQNGSDPLKFGLVNSINRPGGNLTGISNFSVLTATKRLELIRELVPGSPALGWLLNPRNPNADEIAADVLGAGKTLGRTVVIERVTRPADLDSAFSALVGQKVKALVLSADPLFVITRDHIIALATKHAIGTMHAFRDGAAAGGLVSYGPNSSEMYRLVGTYAGRILKGENPVEMPVLHPTKFELVLNLKTARALGITVPLTLQAAADEVIE